MKFLKLLALFLSFGLIVSCGDDDDPNPGDGEETISEVVLTFTPTNDEFDVVTATWFDADGEGSGAPTIDQIDLVEAEEYTLTIELTNTLVSPNDDVTAEIRDEDDEHQFFFSFTNNIFSDPMGDGNIDDASHAINYGDQDDNGNPLGLTTTWTAGAHTETTGEFTVLLKHQPGQKTATSNATVGGTDIDITFPLAIVEDPNVEEEFIDEVVLTFTPADGGSAVVVTWFDPDGDGVADGEPDGPINLAPNTQYELAITLANTVEGEDVTEEIEEEDDEHQFFFSFTTDIFSSPMGDGNVDMIGENTVNYNDMDDNGLPVGLSTNWTTGSGTSNSTFNVILKHQPGVKTDTSDATVGGTDIDIDFTINIQ